MATATATADPVVLGDTTTCTGTTTPSGTLDCSSESTTARTESTPITPTPTSDDKDDATYPHHVIFVVHGMGRQLEEYGNYEPNVASLVENTRTVLQSTYHELKTDVHIIPTEWHSKLHGLVDDRMSLASLKTVPKVRMVMNDYLADILYYFNGHFGTTIIGMIVEELNESYEKFMAEHPDFNGKISIFALSLGGVAMYDILTCQDDDVDDDDKDDKDSTNDGQQKEETKTKDVKPTQDPNSEQMDQTSTKDSKPKVRKQDQTKFRAVVPKLKFRPHYLFTVGSPVGAVLVMRNLQWEDFHPPDDIIHHNLFHPFDPLGYRIEPLIDPVFAKIPATVIRSFNKSQSYFPSISLPSLPSLLPGSISMFWENKVPALPRPSIPTLSNLSQMTQSLKAGIWLSGSTTGTGVVPQSGTSESSNNSSGEESPVTPGEQEEEGGRGHHTDGEEGEGFTPSTTSISEHEDNGDDDTVTDERVTRKKKNRGYEPALVGGADASVSECMAAVTVAAYLDQKKRSRPDAVDTRTGFADTTTGLTSPTSPRRPHLGPRRVSSRVDDEDRQETSPRAPTTPLPKVVEEVVGDTASAHQQDEAPETSTAAPSPRVAKEIDPAEVLDAKSNVVLESMPQAQESNPPQPVEPIEALASESPLVQDTTNDSNDNSNNNSTAEESNGDPRPRTVHVEGRATKLPYRLDHVLQETTADQYTNEYLLSMRSHFKYWGNKDIAYHILRTMLETRDPSKDEILDLTVSTPIATAKAPPPASAPLRSRTGPMSTSELEAKKYNRRSFAFSFFGGYESSSSDSHQHQGHHHHHHRHHHPQGRYEDEIDSDIEMMDEEGELFGYRYRYSDLEVESNSNNGGGGLDVKTLGRNKSRVTQSMSYVNIESKYPTRSTRIAKRSGSNTSIADRPLEMTPEISAETTTTSQ
ncbi:DDHD domain-containing protein [Mortierella sp. GBAus27b]|nr:hypothetical protein BGX31_009299 [Mortierella sp. GBA43]KAI8358185.1 DDHD domain-containing protein [Mortierella sp. GBAus27b]